MANLKILEILVNSKYVFLAFEILRLQETVVFYSIKSLNAVGVLMILLQTLFKNFTMLWHGKKSVSIWGIIWWYWNNF